MKKSFYSVLAMMALAAGTILAASCGDSKDTENSAENAGAQTPDTTKVEHEGFAPTTNIHYIDSDSIIRAYEYAKKEMSRLDQQSLELQQYQNSLGAQIQKKANEIQQKGQNNGYLSQQSYEADMNELQTMQQNAEANYGRRAQAFSIEMAKVQETIIKAIENYVIKYNKEKKYDAILLKSAGVYFNPALDITDEIIKGLNAELGATENADETKAADDKSVK